MEMRIRRARPEEADQLTELCIRSKRSNGYDDAFMAACRDELTITAEDILNSAYWVAEADALSGCAALYSDPDGRRAEVHAFFIDPDRQRQGVGQMLWRTLSNYAIAQGLQELHLDADPGAVPFYEAMGFTVVGAAPSGSIPGRRIPHMTLALT